MRKRIVEQLEKENLLEILAEKIYYKNVIVKKIVEGNSPFNPSFNKIDLIYRESYFIEGEELFLETKNCKYDEWDFVLLPDKSPVLTGEIIKPTMCQIKQLLLKLPEDQLVNIILKAKTIQEIRRYQLSEEIINYMENNRLTTILLNNMCYINKPERKRKLRKSKKTEEWTNLHEVELTYRKYYLLCDNNPNKSNILHVEELKIEYDEADYTYETGKRPLSDEALPLTKNELLSLIKRLPYNELQLIIKKIEQIVDSINSNRQYGESLQLMPKLIMK